MENLVSHDSIWYNLAELCNESSIYIAQLFCIVPVVQGFEQGAGASSGI